MYLKTHIHDKKKSFLLVLFLTLTTLLLISPAHAQVDVSEIPQRIADSLNVPLFAGQMIMTTIIMGLCLFPSFLLTRNQLSHLFMGFGSMSVCIAIGWCPYWILLLIALIVAGLYATKMRGILGG